MFKIHGAPRTCTNYLTYLINQNLSDAILTERAGWKHGLPASHLWQRDQYAETPEQQAILSDNFNYFICIKNPYAWFDSFIRGLEDGHFLPNHLQKHERSGLLIEWIQEDEDYKHQYNNPEYIERYVKYYQTMYKTWISHAEDNGIPYFVVRHEDLLEDPEEILRAIANQFGLAIDGSFQSTFNRIGSSAQEEDERFDPRYYTTHQYRNNLTDTQEEIITDEIDWLFFSRRPFCYQLSNNYDV